MQSRPGAGLFRLAQPGHSSFYNQLLPVFSTAVMLSDILKEEMRFGNNPGIESDFAGVIGGHPLIVFGDFRFPDRELARERPDREFLPGRSRRVLRGNEVQKEHPDSLNKTINLQLRFLGYFSKNRIQNHIIN